jgi:hypothetical protein
MLGNRVSLHLASSPSKDLETFLAQYPKITDAPVYGRWKSPSKDVPEIRNLRMAGITLLSTGQRFGLSESAVSRICADKPEQRRR